MPAAVLTAAAALALATCVWPRREPWERAPLPAGGVEVRRLAAGPPLALDRVRFRFRATDLDEPRFFLALVPQGGAAARDVLIFNHGWVDRPEDLLRELKIDEVYARLLASGRVRPAILVLPEVRFPNAFRLHADRYPYNQGLDLIAQVASLVSSHYGIAEEREHWAIGGFSFGGFVALDVGRRYPGRFRSVSVWSSFYDKDWTFWPTDPPPPGRLDVQGRGKQTVVVAGPIPRLMLGCGTEDRFYRSMVQLHELLLARGIAHEWLTARGGHTWEYWSSVLEPMFVFHLGSQRPPWQ